MIKGNERVICDQDVSSARSAVTRSVNALRHGDVAARTNVSGVVRHSRSPESSGLGPIAVDSGLPGAVTAGTKRGQGSMGSDTIAALEKGSTYLAINPILEESECWKVSGVRTADEFFQAVSLLVPDATHMFLEGSPDPDVEAALADAPGGSDYAAPAGTFWSWPRTNKRFSVRASPALFERLSQVASGHAEPEICDHIHFYRDGVALVQWFDAFSDPMLVSKSVPRERVERFAAACGGGISDGAE
jgi:hypothetical protein